MPTGKGFTIECDDGGNGSVAPATSTAFACVRSMNAPQNTRREFEFNCLDNTGDFIQKEYGLREGGVVNFEQKYSEAEFVRADALNGDEHEWIISAPSPSTLTITFDGTLVDTQMSISSDEVLVMTHSVAVSGNVVVAT